MAIPDGKTIAPHGGGLARLCPECRELVPLELVISDVYEIQDAHGNLRTVWVPEGADAPEGASARGQHTDYDDSAYREHYASIHRGDE